ncbi:MAG: heavy metal-responsive transcriptional regulator, partial [Sandaracinus sp.]|nr:heavy metal-responsive transcriptional regulator [Sandaracinus sp.]
MTTLTIGKVAKAAGLGVETMRFYERQGLIAEPARSDSGYRQYGPETIRR